MKKIINVIVLLLLVFSWVGCEDFLTRPPKDDLTDKTFWTSEENVKAFSWKFYPHFFYGYGQSFAFGKFFSGSALNDNFAPSGPPKFNQQVPTSGGGWSFSWVRIANVMLDRVQDVPMSPEAIDHWSGVARFWRALEYAKLVRRFGDVPWYGDVLKNNETDKLYKPRMPRTVVMDSVLADFQYAVTHVRSDAEQPQQMVDKYVVWAMMSRVFLFEGTWLKYHNGDAAKAQEYLTVAKNAAKEVIGSGRYSITSDYRGLFNSLSLAGNPGIILYRKYVFGVFTHSLVSYSNGEPQTGASRDAFEAYLCTDGLPISLSASYQGNYGINTSIDDVFANRDPRMSETFVQELRLNGIIGKYATSGYSQHKFLNEDIADEQAGNSNDNPTDSPVIRYGEILLNYAEAAAELGNLTQQDLDLSINVLRSRPGIGIPPLQVSGGLPAVNGQTYDDPERDPTVPPMIWEIRRERRIELMMEGFRKDDLRRWNKLEYADMTQNPDINRGAWIDKADYPNTLEVHLEDGKDTGYIVPAFAASTIRTLYDPRVYLWPLPLDQITLYSEHGVTLEQNPGW